MVLCQAGKQILALALRCADDSDDSAIAFMKPIDESYARGDIANEDLQPTKVEQRKGVLKVKKRPAAAASSSSVPTAKPNT